MKRQTTMTNITRTFKKVYQTGYCNLQNIFKYDEPQYYNCGMYGWNCDTYIDYERDIAITTGYRNMRGVMIPREIIKKYDEIAVNILKDTFAKPYEEIKKLLDENKQNFLNEIYNY